MFLTSMSETECPQSQVRGCVRDGPQTVLNGVNSLVHKGLSELKLKCVEGGRMWEREREGEGGEGRERRVGEIGEGGERRGGGGEINVCKGVSSTYSGSQVLWGTVLQCM